MGRREQFLKSIRREEEGYIPFEFSLCPSLCNKFKEKTGKDDYEDFYGMPYRFIALSPFERNVDFSKYFTAEELSGNISFWKDWGVCDKKGELHHFSKMLHPMKNFTTIEEFMSYPYPDPVKDYNWASFNKKVEAIKSSDNISVGAMNITIFEISWYLRGMEQFMIDLLTEPELAEYHLDKITSIRCDMARRFALSGVDVLHLGDDVATQLDMMISPETWRNFLKPRLKKVIDTAREVNPDILIDYHSDGNIEKIVPELIEIGVDILNPVQPECMDPVKMKELYGDRLSFRGAIGTQTTMPFGTPEEVYRVCEEMIKKIGKGGGFILAPTHLLEPEVPWKNIEAMLEAVKKYSK